ncbi:hypothetical protein D6C95_03380 [Aureobasidium pullulans]|nr:hypothetical protein D6C95_03380 [Aureobasidium pullulans]
MLKSIIVLAVATFSPAVLADVCKANFNLFFFSWTVNLSGINGGCDATLNGMKFQQVMQAEGGCAAVTNFSCKDPAEGGTTFKFNQSDFCSGGAIADAVRQVFGTDDFTCSGQGPV